MSLDLVKFAFVAGELSPTFHARNDLEKFDLGMQTAINWFVDYRGGVSNRPGTLFVDYIMHDDLEVKLFPFKYAPNIANTYVLLFGHNYLRFVQDGAYVLEDAVTISAITNAATGVVTAPAHGFSNGDWIKLATSGGMSRLHGRTVVVANATTNTFELKDVFGNSISTVGSGTFSVGTASRIYTIATPYSADKLVELKLYQFRDLVRITHQDFPPHELFRLAATNWTLTQTDFGTEAVTPTGLTLTPLILAGNPSGQAAVGFCVTSVNQAGEESLACPVVVNTTGQNYTTTDGGMKLVWNAVADAQYYNVYRTLVIDKQADFSPGAQVGYLGRAYGPEFTDNNIVPDFTITPPNAFNPFANLSVKYITITNGGTGYGKYTTTVSLSGGGTGFVGQVLVNSAGNVIGVLVINGGQNYVAPTVSFAGTGTGATATAHMTEGGGNYPKLSTRFQQRQLYAATLNKPLTVFGSKPKQYNNFDFSNIVADNDSYEFDLDSEEVTPIRHMQTAQGGLLLMTDGGIWQLSGGGGLNTPVTPTKALADPQTFTGISDLPPLTIDTDLIYTESKGYTVRLLSYNDYSRTYGGQDISLLSNHLFSAKNYMTEWAFASDPYKLIWGRRLDGTLLMFTMLKEQNIFAWTRAQTRGRFENLLSIQEERTDSVYVTVTRWLNGRRVKLLERFAPRNISTIDDAHFLDCGLTLGSTYPDATIEVSAVTGTVVVTANTGVFNLGDVGKIIYVAGGKVQIDAYSSPTVVFGTVLRTLTNIIPENTFPEVIPAEPGTWTLDRPITTIGGLHHLEGVAVNVLYDGKVLADTLVVMNGEITIPEAASRISVGFSYKAVLQTLPLAITQASIENRRKRIMGIGTRFYQARGIKFGTKLSKLYPVKERTVEVYGEPTNLITDMKNVFVQSDWKVDATLWIVQEEPLPASILGFVTQAEIGDDPN